MGRQKPKTENRKAKNAVFILTLSLIWLILPQAVCLGATFYVDPVSGTMSNDGSYNNPWSTLQEVFDNGLIGTQVLSGDTILLRSGYHGEIVYSNAHNSDYITIAAQTGHTPGFKRIRLNNASKWIFRGLSISPELDPGPFQPTTLFNIEGSSYIVIENNDMFITQDSSNWTIDDWLSFVVGRHGIYGRSTNNITVRNNTIKNVYAGILAWGPNWLVEYNTIENFGADGIQGGNYQVVQYNIVKNSYNINDNHDDCFQIGVGTNHQVVLRGNIFITLPDSSNPLLHGAQGIGLWDGPYYDFIIENNIVISTHIMGGISLFDGQNSKIINNIVFNPLFPEIGSATYIRLGSKGHGGNDNITIRNNISHSFPSNQGTIYSDHNFDIDDYNRDDLFVDYSNFDYRHKEGSPAIDAGSPDLAPDIDILGTPRPQGAGYDIGCYEYISTGPQPPIADAGTDQTVVDSDGDGSEEITLDGSGSFDPDGTIVSYVWNEGGLEIATGINPTVTLSIGTHSITLTVTDNEGLIDTDTVTITVSPSNQPPVANAGPDQTVIDEDNNGEEQVTLDGSGSQDPDGTIASFIWSEGGSQIAIGINPTVTLSIGTHLITLTVTDNEELIDTDTVTITVSPPTQPPIANAGADQTVTDNDGNGSEEVTLDGSGSQDPDGEIVSYVWSEDGLQIATGINPTVTLSIGEHSITLTVTDDGGLTDTDTVTIKVLEGDKEFGKLPTGCYNNVFNPTKGEKALIVVKLQKQAHVKISLYNTRGNKIKELADEERDAGPYKYYWDGRDDSENIVGSGLYFVHIQAGDYKKTKKIVVVK